MHLREPPREQQEKRLEASKMYRGEGSRKCCSMGGLLVRFCFPPSVASPGILWPIPCGVLGRGRWKTLNRMLERIWGFSCHGNSRQACGPRLWTVPFRRMKSQESSLKDALGNVISQAYFSGKVTSSWGTFSVPMPLSGSE